VTASGEHAIATGLAISGRMFAFGMPLLRADQFETSRKGLPAGAASVPSAGDRE
jgi:hypothetical protein